MSVIISPLSSSFYKSCLSTYLQFDISNNSNSELDLKFSSSPFYFNKLFDSISINKIPTSNSLFKKILYNIYCNSFVSIDCIEYIELNTFKISTYSISDINVKIYICSNNILEIDINHVFNIVKWINKFSYSKSPLTLFIYLIPYTKKISFSSQILTINEINSGSSNNYTNNITIYRYEEIYKVLIHELVHFYNLDIKSDIDINVDNILPLSLPCFPFYLNEAVTEAITLILHTYYYSQIKQDNFISLLYKEIEYSKKLFYIILFHHNITSFKQLFSLCQYTNVISYYILKYILIEDINEALICLFDKSLIKKFIISKLIKFLSNDNYLIHNIKLLNYPISTKMCSLSLN